MEARRIGRLAGGLRQFLHLFDDCFSRSEGREHMQLYVHGQFQTLGVSVLNRWRMRRGCRNCRRCIPPTHNPRRRVNARRAHTR